MLTDAKNTVKMSILPKAMFTCKASLVRTPMAFFTEI